MLPDGWFGRPYDNQYWLIAVDDTPERLLVEFDDGNSLRFFGPVRLEVQGNEAIEGSDLHFSDFNLVVWTYRWYGGDNPLREKRYESGEVILIGSHLLREGYHDRQIDTYPVPRS
jgi:hypothetical protein